MMNSKEGEIDGFLEEVDSIPTLLRHGDCYEDVVTYSSCDIIGLGIDVDIHQNMMDVFLSFGYSDISLDLVGDQYPDIIEELESNEYKYWCEKYFVVFLREEGKRFVCKWDDGCLMCPGYVPRIGYRHISCDIDTINDFISVCEAFYAKIKSWGKTTLFSRLTADFLERSGYHTELPFQLENSRIEIIRSKIPIRGDLLQSPYIGEEYAFFTFADSNEEVEIVSVSAPDIRMFMDIIANCEYIDNITYFIINNELIGLSRHFAWISSYERGPIANYASRVEQNNIIAQIQLFLPYADEGLRNIYFEEYKNGLPHGKAIIIYTEGITDCKHMEYHWNFLRHDSKWLKLDIDFEIYKLMMDNIKNTSRPSMGGDQLYNMCLSLSRGRKNREILVFIADRDTDDVVRKLSDGESKFKYWGNNVYSLVLPVPRHRENTPRICIEHYYVDEEIKMEFTCADGIKRRLYIGSEFDEYGRAIAIDRFCTNRQACGGNSIRIIDGSSNERVLCLTRDDGINYALSKMRFAELMCSSSIMISDTTKEAFGRLFEVILSIKMDHDRISKNISNTM